VAYDPVGLEGEFRSLNWKYKALLWAVLFGFAIFVFVWDSTEREARAALEARLNEKFDLATEPQSERGVLCGTYGVAPSGPRRFIFVSHYSGATRSTVGLHLEADKKFSSLSAKYCGSRLPVQ
jgi:hypothetical protein